MTNPSVSDSSIELPIACDLTAIPLSERTAHISVGLHILGKADHVQELPNSYAFRFANEPGVFMQIAHFVENERRCCQFYTFGIELEPGGGPLWLRLTGGEGVKEFVQALFGDMSKAVGQKLIHTGNDDALRQAVNESAPRLASVLAKAKPTQ